MADIEFVAGMLVKAPAANMPDFLRAKISIKVDEFVPWLKTKMAAKEEWINLDICQSASGKWYAKVNSWKPEEKKAPRPAAPTGRPAASSDPLDDSEIPF